MTTRRRTLAGYELEHRLGEGAAGTVWRARQRSSPGRPVALKRVRVPDGAEELRLEAAVLVELDHPHVVRVFELVPDGEDGVAIAMQLAAGGSLEERLARRGPLPPAEVAAIVRKLAGALASAHRRGVLHRDVKPGNILFTSDGEPLLADFGIAGWVDDGLIRGSEPYLDPTVLAGRGPDASSDLYSLAVVAREQLGGSIDGAGEPLRSALARCLAGDPSARFTTADDLVAALDGGVVVGERLDDRSATRTFGPRPPATPPDPVPRALPWRAVAAVAGAVLVLTGAALALRPTAPPVHASPVEPACTPVRAIVDELVGDVDGDGCDDRVPREGNVLTHDGHRYEVGDPGDVILLGDWDCDGRATPAAYRPAAGEAHVFNGWAEPGRPLPAVRTIDATAPPAPDCR